MQLHSGTGPIESYLYLAMLALIMWPAVSAQNYGDAGNETRGIMSEAQILIKEADDLFNSDQYVQARSLYKRALAKAEIEIGNSDQVEALSMIARTYLILNEVEAGREWLLKAEKLADDHDPLGWSRYQSVKGRFLWQEKRPDEATALFKSLYEYCSGRKLYERAIDAAHMVAITGTQDEQVEWGKKGIKEAETGQITRWLGALWNNLGATYEDMGRYDSSLEAYMKAREYHYKYGTDRNKVIADYAVGHALVNLKRFQEAGQWLRPVLTQCEQAHDDEFIGLTCRDLGEIGVASGNYQEALDLLVRARDILKSAQMDQWDPDGYRKILDQIEATQSRLE